METTPATDKTQPISVSHTQIPPHAPATRALLPPPFSANRRTLLRFLATMNLLFFPRVQQQVCISSVLFTLAAFLLYIQCPLAIPRVDYQSGLSLLNHGCCLGYNAKQDIYSIYSTSHLLIDIALPISMIQQSILHQKALRFSPQGILLVLGQGRGQLCSTQVAQKYVVLLLINTCILSLS